MYDYQNTYFVFSLKMYVLNRSSCINGERRVGSLFKNASTNKIELVSSKDSFSFYTTI